MRRRFCQGKRRLSRGADVQLPPRMFASPCRLVRPLEEMVPRLERAAAASPADETEITWIEARRGRRATARGRRDSCEAPGAHVLVRVRESRPHGAPSHRRHGDLAELENAVRRGPRPGAPRGLRLRPRPPTAPRPRRRRRSRTCTTGALARLTPAGAKDLVQRLAGTGGDGETRPARPGRRATGGVGGASGSRGLRRATRATAAGSRCTCGAAPGAGRGRGGRALAGRAGRRGGRRAGRAPARTGGPPAEDEPRRRAGRRCCSPRRRRRALVDLLNRQALSSLSFRDGVSFLRERLGQPVFHPADQPARRRHRPARPALPLRPAGRRRGGRSTWWRRASRSTPALDDGLAAALDLPPTAQAVAPDEALASHLFLLPRTGRPDEDLAAPDGRRRGLDRRPRAARGASIPAGLRFRAVARGVRRLAGGRAGRALPDLVWEDDLPALLSRRVLGTGRRRRWLDPGRRRPAARRRHRAVLAGDRGRRRPAAGRGRHSQILTSKRPAESAAPRYIPSELKTSAIEPSRADADHAAVARA